MAVQTHKTIIFEEFDKAKTENLFTIISNTSGDKLSEELKKLIVFSFNDFIKKFSPKVYEVCGKNPESGEFEFFYTTDLKDYPGASSSEIKIEEQAYYKMLSRLYSEKGTSGLSNLQFKDEEILEILTPKKELEEVRNIRQNFEYNLLRLNEAKASGDRETMRECREKILDCRKKIADYFKTSLNKLLPILIEDTNAKLKSLGKGKISSAGSDVKSLPKSVFGKWYLNPEGKIDVDENWQEKNQEQKLLTAAESTEKNSSALVEVKNTGLVEIKNLPTKSESNSNTVDRQVIRNKIAETIMKDYDENAEVPIEEIKSLIVSTFAPLATNQNTKISVELDETKLRERKENFESAYVKSKQSFANAMSKIIESLLGVKTFFDHATVDGGESSEIPGGVIIANCKASRLLTIEDKFSEFVKTQGKDQGSERIWFAVLPNVLENPPVQENFADDEDDDGLGGSLNDIEEINSSKSGEDYVSINSAKKFLEIMQGAQITTIFNIKSKKGNTFADLTVKDVEDKMKTFSTQNYSHAVYAYPNFTLIRDKNFKPFGVDNDAEITLPGIFIDAAYPAAGLLVASQQQKILDSRKLKYDSETPCVGINFESLPVKRAFPTKFNRESVLRRSEDLIKVLDKNMFGFAFSGDEVHDEGGIWKNSYVHCAGTLCKNEKSGRYKPIRQTLIEDFIALELKLLPSKEKSEVQKKIRKINNEWVEKNHLSKFKDIANFILRDGEEIELVEDGNKMQVIIHFQGGDSYVDFEITSVTNND